MAHEMTMRDYIELQPETMRRIFAARRDNLAAFLDFYAQVRPDHVYIIASGSSYNASCAAAVYMRRALQIDVTVHVPSQLPDVHTARPMIIAVSQGGESTNTIAAIKAMADYPLIAVTGREECTVNTLCDRRFDMGCGLETVGPKTVGYTSTIYAFSLLALEAGYASGRMDQATYEQHTAMFEAVADQMQENLKRTDDFVAAHLEEFCACRKIAFTGKGVGGELAKEGALKVLETLLIPAFHYEFEEYLHGPVCAIDGELAGVYMVSHDADKARMLAVAGAHDQISPNAYVITGDDSVRGERVLNLVTSGDDATMPFEAILLAQLVASEVPVKLDMVNKGMKQFRVFDDLVKTKAIRR